MARKKTALTAIITVLAMITGCSAEAPTDATSVTCETASETVRTEITTAVSEISSSSASGYIPHSQLLDCLYYDERDFIRYDEKSEAYAISGEPLCGVAPHHLIAGHLIAGLYKIAALREKTETVIVIAPMHYKSDAVLTTSFKGWDTAFGAAENDTDITGMFTEKLGAKDDDEMTAYDHSVSSHIPFIKRYLPDAKVACLLVSPYARGDLPVKLSELLAEVTRDKQCFVAFSIDFSHYLDPPDADSHDKETLDAVMSGRTSEIEHFTDSNVDSPYCLSTFVRLSELLGGKITKSDSANTFTVVNVPYSRTTFPEGVTSYFVFFSSKA